MKTKVIITTVLLALAPAIAVAQGCDHGDRVKASLKCQEGQTWDAASGSCVTPLNG